MFLWIVCLGCVFTLAGCCGRKIEPGKKTGVIKAKKDIIKKEKLKLPEKVKSKNFMVVPHTTSNFQRNYVILPGGVRGQEFKKSIDYLASGKWKVALPKLEELKRKYPPGSKEAELICYQIASCYFAYVDLQKALYEYKKFLKLYPDSPLADNARAAIKYIENIDRYRKTYVPPEKDR